MLQDPELERDRLETVVGLGQACRILDGHQSEWIEELRSRAERIEVRLLKRLVVLSNDRDAAASLAWARRWSELDPFDDNAHTAVARSLGEVHGNDAAAEYVTEIDDRYQRELDAPFRHGTHLAIDHDGDQPPRPRLGDIDDLVTRAKRLDEHCADPEQQAQLLRAIDQRLRAAGHHNRRLEFLEALANLDDDPADMRWRKADLAAIQLDRRKANELVADRTLLDPLDRSQAMLTIAAAMNDTNVDRAKEALVPIVGSAESSVVVLEARLLTAHLHDLQHDLPAAERTLLNVCRDADRADTNYCTAAALSALGWNRTRAGDSAQAEAYLTEALELSERIGADAARAAAYGGMGHLRHMQNRYSSALRLVSKAADLCNDIGDVRSEFRWCYGAVVTAGPSGDIVTIRRRHHRLREIAKGSGDESFIMKYAVGISHGVLLSNKGDFEAALTISRSLEREAREVGALNLALHCRQNVTRLLFILERYDEALVATNAMLAYGERASLPQSNQNEALALLGSALTAVGDPSAGIGYLRDATNGSQDGLTHAAIHWYWLFRATTELGLADEAQATLVRIERYLKITRGDLDDVEWARALTHNPELRKLASLV